MPFFARHTLPIRSGGHTNPKRTSSAEIVYSLNDQLGPRRLLSLGATFSAMLLIILPILGVLWTAVMVVAVSLCQSAAREDAANRAQAAREYRLTDQRTPARRPLASAGPRARRPS